MKKGPAFSLSDWAKKAFSVLIPGREIAWSSAIRRQMDIKLRFYLTCLHLGRKCNLVFNSVLRQLTKGCSRDGESSCEVALPTQSSSR
jgi:hypothetical protein